jgi:integrase
MTLGEFVSTHWWSEVAIAFKPSTLRVYNVLLEYHLLPAFGDYPLPAITRAVVKRFIAEKAHQRCHSRSRRNPNPNRPNLTPKSIKNVVALLGSLLEVAAVDYNLLDHNPLRGILRRTQFPTEANRLRGPRMRVLEPEDFRRAVGHLRPLAKEMVVVAALTGLRWGELIGLRMEEDVDFRRNKLHITRAFYRRVPQTPKTPQSIRSVEMCPTVRQLLQGRKVRQGLVFSADGMRPMGAGNWVKQQWRDAQLRAGVRSPITWHDLRHQFVSLLIAAGKHPKYIAVQAGHSSAGFTLDRYGSLFETLPVTPVEWWDDLLWLGGHYSAAVSGEMNQSETGGQAHATIPKTSFGDRSDGEGL